MNNKEILQKAIEKAIQNGWVLQQHCESLECVIWDHDFAKAFWGEKETIYLQL